MSGTDDVLGGLIDYGEEPESLRESRAMRDAIIGNSNNKDDGSVDNAALLLLEDDPDPNETMRIPVAHKTAVVVEVTRTTQERVPRRRKPTERVRDHLDTAVRDSVRIKMPKLTMSMDIMEFCVTEQALAFFVPLGTTFEPDLKTEIEITHDSTTYRVIYAGGFFTFQELGFSLVSFLRVDRFND